MGLCGGLLLAVSWSLFLATLPLSLCVCFKVRMIYAAMHGFTMVVLCVCFKVRIHQIQFPTLFEIQKIRFIREESEIY